MGIFSIWHWLIVLAVIVVIFGGKGKITSFFTDLALGLKAFKKGLEDKPSKIDNIKKSTKN